MGRTEAALAPYVVGLRSYDVVGEPGVHIGLPSTTLTLVLPVADPLDVAWAGRPQSRGRFDANLAGLHAVPAAIHHGRRQQGVYVELTPAAARALVGVPAAALAGQLLDPADLDPGLRHLPEQLAETPAACRESVVRRALLSALARHDAPGPRAEVGRALAGLTRGQRVDRVAEEVGYSRRHLADLVRAEYGVSPREVRRLGRFERSRRHVVAAAQRRCTLAEAAARAGYADQAHLSREWRDLAGCSPTEWIRREVLPNVQDPSAPGGAVSEHD
jgi:AraC-like DNA-binding protein